MQNKLRYSVNRKVKIKTTLRFYLKLLLHTPVRVATLKRTNAGKDIEDKDAFQYHR